MQAERALAYCGNANTTAVVSVTLPAFCRSHPSCCCFVESRFNHQHCGPLCIALVGSVIGHVFNLDEETKKMATKSKQKQRDESSLSCMARKDQQEAAENTAEAHLRFLKLESRLRLVHTKNHSGQPLFCISLAWRCLSVPSARWRWKHQGCGLTATYGVRFAPCLLLRSIRFFRAVKVKIIHMHESGTLSAGVSRQTATTVAYAVFASVPGPLRLSTSLHDQLLLPYFSRPACLWRQLTRQWIQSCLRRVSSRKRQKQCLRTRTTGSR